MFKKLMASTIIAYVLTGLPALGENARSDLAKDDWTRINQYSPLESYQSKGSYGWHLGIGALTNLHEDRRPKDPLYEDEREPTAPRFFLSTGTAWPIDVGVSASYFTKAETWQYGGHVQWTIFEGFRLPSMALRYSHIGLTDMQELGSIKTNTLQLGFSYGFFRYLNLSLAIGQQWEQGNTQAYESPVFALTEEEVSDWREQRTTYSWGLNIVPLTPYIQLAIEQVFWKGEPRVALGKISFLL